jgi:hypothetical protein
VIKGSGKCETSFLRALEHLMRASSPAAVDGNQLGTGTKTQKLKEHSLRVHRHHHERISALRRYVHHAGGDVNTVRLEELHCTNDRITITR